MKKKELDLEKLGKVTGGFSLMDQCQYYWHAESKPADHKCESCEHYVENEDNPGKYYCKHPSQNTIAR